jgi:hypothetical protein
MSPGVIESSRTLVDHDASGRAAHAIENENAIWTLEPIEMLTARFI